MSGIDVLRVSAEQRGDLIDNDLMDEIGQVAAVPRSDLQRTAVQHDPGRKAMAGVGEPGREKSGQRDIAVLEHVAAVDELVRTGRTQVRNVLDRELHAVEFTPPAMFEILDRVQHQIIELSGT